MSSLGCPLVFWRRQFGHGARGEVSPCECSGREPFNVVLGTERERGDLRGNAEVPPPCAPRVPVKREASPRAVRFHVRQDLLSYRLGQGRRGGLEDAPDYPLVAVYRLPVAVRLSRVSRHSRSDGFFGNVWHRSSLRDVGSEVPRERLGPGVVQAGAGAPELAVDPDSGIALSGLRVVHRVVVGAPAHRLRQLRRLRGTPPGRKGPADQYAGEQDQRALTPPCSPLRRATSRRRRASPTGPCCRSRRGASAWR